MTEDNNQLVSFTRLDALSLSRKPSALAVFVIDVSSSMAKHNEFMKTALRQALTDLLQTINGREYYCAIVIFGEFYGVLLPITHISQIDIEALVDSYQATERYTICWRTVYKTLRLFTDIFEQLTPEERANICLTLGVFSDGEDNYSNNHDPEADKYPRIIPPLAAKAQQLGIELMTYGFGIRADILAKEMGFPHDDSHTKSTGTSPQDFSDATRDFTRTVAFGHDSAFRRR